ncbi:PAS domain-containing protein [Leptolyngbya sp. CCNP1308]|uniref:PAS domain-containing protein n=1 Tax=Leptolyngbya sp. CCNP1308 TaxID=3110255 RepID=UPI002B1ED611|nr:PAS domain-containing protein [Leptolyngbya sp. CCNP1308]MEA5448236.1 PAS domain-containing protein [Leptolyngbya sp. CCNP1308]
MSPSSPFADSDRLRHIARHIPGVIYEFVQYPDGRMAFPYASVGLEDLCGISPAAVREDVSPLFSIVHPDDLAYVAQSIQDSATHLTPWCCEYRLYHPQGRLLWLQSHATPQRELDGTTRWYGCIQDVTQQKANQLALEASDRKLRRLIDTINGLVFVIVSDGTLSFLSPMVTTVTGHSLDELLHRPFADVTHPDDLAHVVEQVQACLHGKSCRGLEFRVRHQDGRHYWYSANLSPFVAEAGAAIACLGIATYIDDRKRTALALQESEARYQSLGVNVPGMVYRYLPSGEGGAFTYVSAGCYELFGVKPEQVQQDANLLWDLIHPDDLPSLQASVASAVEQGADWAWEGRFTTVTGQPRWLQGRSRPQFTIEGLVWDGLLIDITALKQAEATLSQEVGYRRALFDASGDGIVVLDATGQVLEANRSFATMLGYSLKEAIGLNVADFDVALEPTEDKQETSELCLNRFERRHRRRDESTFAVEICASAVQWNGQSVHLCVCRDIEERRRAEITLAASEARFQQLAAASPAVIYTVVENAAGIVRFDYISPAAAEIHEIPLTTLMQNGALVSEQIHPEDRERYLATYVASLRDMATFTCEWRIITPSGKTKWLKANSRPERRPNGDVAWHGVVLEKTAKKEAEIEIAKLQAALLEAQQIAHIGNWAFDLIGQTITWSPELFRMFGLDPAAGEPTYDDYLQMIHPDDRSRLVQAVDQAITQGTSYKIDYRALLPDGSIRYHEGRGKIGRDGAGQIIRLSGTCLDITKRKQSELALQASQMRLELALDSSGTGTWDWNMQTNEVIFSQQHWKALVGYGADETVANAVTEWEGRVHPEDQAQLEADIAKHLRGETEIYENVHRLRCQDDTYKWNSAQGKIIEWDEHGNPVRFIGINRDITDRKHAEIALADLREKLEKAQEVSHLGHWSFDLDTQEITWSDEVFRIFGMAPEQDEPTFSEHFEQIYPEDRSFFLERIAEANQGIPQNVDFRILRPNGEIRYVNSRLELEYKGEQIVRMFGVVMDITDRKQSELALQASEARFRAIFEQAAAGINQVDASGYFVEANQYYCNLLGYAKDELLALTFADVIHPEDLAQHRPQIDRILRGEIDNLNYEKRDRHKNGDWIWTKISISTLRDEAGQIVGNLAVVVDIRDRKRAEHIVRQQAARETLLREISQRIRQSLDLPTIFNTACQEIRACLNADRVGIFKFYADSGYDDGEFVAESSADGLPSVLATRVHDHCFGANYANLYAQGHYFVVDDIYSAGIANCHTDILARFQVRASLVLPLLCGNKLWGLLCIHQCSRPRQWPQSDIDLGNQLASQLAIALQQALLYRQLQSELRVRQRAEAQIAQQLYQQTALGVILRQIRESLDLEEILSIVTRQVQAIFQCDRVIVFRVFGDGRSQIVEEVVKEPFPALKAMHWEDEAWSQDILNLYWQGQPRVVPDVMEDVWTDCLVDYSQAGQIQSKVVAPILQEAHTASGDRWVAPDSHHKLWGVLVMHACQTQRVWQDTEAQLLQQIANQLAIAIQQITIFDQLQQELGDRQCAQQQLSDRNQELAIANQDLSRATRLKGEFLANMSHELRTPLNVILGFAQILNADPSLQAQQREYIRIMQRSGDHLLHLINDILDLSKIEANRITLEPESIDLLSLLYDLQAMFQERAEEKDLAFNLALAADLPQYIVTDANKLRQVLINLLGNAVKFTQVGGIILRVDLLSGPKSAIETAPESKANLPQAHLAFTVEDTGTGIAPDELTAIFDAFIQAKAGKVSLEGTGLGLAISRSLVHLMKGDLTVDSTPGQGSSFRFTLPLQLADAADVAVADNLGSVIGLAPGQPTYRILVVDDQPENRYFLVAVFSQLGLAVQEAINGADAIARWQQWHPHLIWMDLRMPGIDGYEATRRIRAEAQERGDGFGPVIIALTAQSSREQRDQALAAGCEDFVSKPVQLNLLLTKMADHLGLQYRYADQGGQALLPKSLSGRLKASDLQVMSPAWVSALHRASVLCDSTEVAQLIQQIPPEHAALIDGLTQLLRDYKFEVLMQLTQV